MSADTKHMLCFATFLLWSLPLNSTATHAGLRYFHWSLWLTLAKLGMRYYNRNVWAWKSSLSWWLSRTFSADWKVIDNPYLVGWIAEISFPGSPMFFFVNFFPHQTIPSHLPFEICFKEIYSCGLLIWLVEIDKNSFININFSVQGNVVIREEITKTSLEVTMIGMCRIK